MYTGGVYRFLALVAGFLVLVVSVGRAGWETIAKEEKEGRLGCEAVVVMSTDKQGGEERYEYRLPEAGVLPGNFWYIFKQIRNSLWVRLAAGKDNKLVVTMVLADKNMAEAKELYEQGQGDRAIESSLKAIDKLEYAQSLLGEIGDSKNEEIEKQLERSGEAYRQVLESMHSCFEMDYYKLQEAIGRADKVAGREI